MTPEIIKTVVTLVTPPLIAGIGWWLSQQFRSAEINMRSLFEAHEKMDNDRHLENRGDIREIKGYLRTLGFRNGSER